MPHIVEIAGARPNFMKIAPVHRAMAEAGGFEVRFVHTGQHYDWEMSQVFLGELGLPEPDFELGVGRGTHAEQTGEVILRLEPYLREHRPDVVVVVGDVNSTLAAALTAAKLDIPVAHVEAGLRSFDRTMPEETNRVVTDVVSMLLFAPSPDAVENLRREGVAEERIHLVGNVMIDSLDRLLPHAEGSDALRRFDLEPRRFFLSTMHRPANVDLDASLDAVGGALLAAATTLPVLLVAHPRTRKRLEETGALARLDAGGVRVIEPLGYLDFLRLTTEAAGVLTDSGGIQEETTVLGVPCLTLRENTERPITVTEGTNVVVGLDAGRIGAEAERIASEPRPQPRRPALWDGRAAERIVEVLAERFAG